MSENSPASQEGVTENECSIIYFCYGSNMNSDKLTGRGGAMNENESSIWYSEAFVGRLPDWRLCFDMYAAPPSEPAMGSIERAEGEDVYGVCYKLGTRACWDNLLISEGGSEKFYHTIDVEVERVINGVATGEMARAKTLITTWAYIIPQSCREYVRPSKRYMDIMIEGAKEHGLPQTYVRSLEDIKVSRKCKPSLATFEISLIQLLSYLANDLKKGWIYRPISFVGSYIFAVKEYAAAKEPSSIGTRALEFFATVCYYSYNALFLVPAMMTLVGSAPCRDNLRRYIRIVSCAQQKRKET